MPQFSLRPYEKIKGIDINDVYSYNYISTVKPWNKPLALMWKEESIYLYLVKKIVGSNILLQNIQAINILRILNKYEEYIKNKKVADRCLANKFLRNYFL